MGFVLVTVDNSDACLAEILNRLTGKTFNMLTEVQKNRLKFCRRELSNDLFNKNGQMSIHLKPGGSVAWDLNVEIVQIEFAANGDILLSRTYKSGKKKFITLTTNPI